MIKIAFTVVAFCLVISTILINLNISTDTLPELAARKYKMIGGLLYVATFLLFIANSLELPE